MTSASLSGAIDAATVSWSGVQEAVYRVRHHYRYTYTGPVTDLKQRLMMVPPDRHDGQRLLEFDLDIRGSKGAQETSWSSDAFGNRLCHVALPGVERAVDFEVRYSLERSASTFSTNGEPPEAYLQPTSLTAPDDRLREAAAVLARADLPICCLARTANEWVASSISYRPGATGVQTPAAMALHLGSGVCQDYAHILLSLLRLLALPARYVSGHLLGEGVPHAWVEVFLREAEGRGAQIVGFDPTHSRRTGMNYIFVAAGRDFADVTPTSGTFSGAATGKLSSSKQATVVSVQPSSAVSREDVQ